MLKNNTKLYFITAEGMCETPAFSDKRFSQYWKHKKHYYEELDKIKNIEELDSQKLIAHRKNYNLIDEEKKLNLSCWNYFKNMSDEVVKIRLMKEAGSKKRTTVELEPGEILATIGTYFDGTHLAVA